MEATAAGRARLWGDAKPAGGDEDVPTGICPECEADVYVETDADKGDTLACDECGTELEIVGLDPIELDIVEDDGEEEEEEEEEQY